ncbi:MAG: LptA/OstA family protein [Bacteriovoracaceae bacterium]|jgi:lipopolysaccharide export system protein LptA|nr:LptA/OstA family protein [Bacteriovoracaceae bacterium]
MYNKRNLFIIILFGFIVGFVITTGLKPSISRTDDKVTSNKKTLEKSYFKNVHYFRSTNLRPEFELLATELNITNNTLLHFQDPEGSFLSEGKKVHYSATKGFMNQSHRILRLDGAVQAFDDTADYVSEHLVYNGNSDIIRASGSVSSQFVNKKTLDIVKVKSERLTSFLKQEKLILLGDVSGKIIRKRRYESGLDFSAQKVVVKSLESLMELSKSVKIYRSNYRLSAESAEIFLENYNKKLKYYVLYDDVKLEEKLKLKNGNFETRRAYAEKLEGHRRSGKIVLTGAPRVEQGGDIIKGYQITLRENVELVEVDDSQSSFKLKRND